MNVKPLNKKSQAIFDDIISDMDLIKNHKKIENSKAFMPLVVERLQVYDWGVFYSFCHYFKQNGDMCQDPEMLFIKHKNGKVFAAMFQQAIPPVYEEGVFFDMDSGAWKVNKRMQADHTSFANMWLKNIKEQQGLS